ncbi:MAG TPA: aldo/keto reductase [Mycobacteriales bacterium]|jgi:2,5-diketo-D-gluconate reductase A|nr:aldo/keto reductase [Mycobacteriales bacterium]
MTDVPNIALNNGQSIPQLGFGVFLVPPEDTARVTGEALQAGYRHIDTAEMYGNEKQVGEAIAASGLDREDIYITSKLDNGFHLPDDARRAFDETLAALGIERIDLFLIHWPLPTRYDGDFVSTWRTLEEFYRDGRARSIGVSNFHAHHLRRLFAECDIVPAVNQIEVHPYLVQDELRKFCAEHQIAVEAWSPIGRGTVLEDPTLRAIAGRYDKTVAQVVLRWHLDRGDIIFPKSMRPERMAENFDIFDFSLDGDDIAAISALDRGERVGPDPETFDRV